MDDDIVISWLVEWDFHLGNTGALCLGDTHWIAAPLDMYLYCFT